MCTKVTALYVDEPYDDGNGNDDDAAAAAGDTLKDTIANGAPIYNQNSRLCMESV